MNRDDIIRMARESRMPYFYGTWEIANLDALERFANLVAAHEREGLAQPEKEPLEYWREHFDAVGCGTIYKTAGEDRVPVYTTPIKRLIDVVGDMALKQGPDYERGFIDGMQKQMQSSVDKAVNAMGKREWVGLTDEEIKEIIGPWGDTPIKGYTRKLFDQIEAKLKEKNT
jgi:hypothetical protein